MRFLANKILADKAAAIILEHAKSAHLTRCEQFNFDINSM